MRPAAAAFLLAALALVSVDATAAQRNFVRHAAAPARDWRTWPFSRRSPWNYPIGSAATYAPVQRLSSYPDRVQLRRALDVGGRRGHAGGPDR